MEKKQYLLTVDGGTTNTRAALWTTEGELLDRCGASVGVRDTAMDGGDNSRLCQAVRDCLAGLVERGGIGWDQVKAILASGMITSNVGLTEIPHLPAPAGVDELARGAVAVDLPQAAPMPIHFIPGVKNTASAIDLDNFESMDMMRGEEVEAVALIQRCRAGRPMLLVLPGSHSKFVGVNAQGQITGCLTSITGELLSVITNDTILADAVERSFVDEAHYNREMMLLGYETARRVGLGRACFSGRVMKLFAGQDHFAVANYLLGCVLENDLKALQGSQAIRPGADTHVVIAGKQPLSRAIYDLLVNSGRFAHVEEVRLEAGTSLSGQGCLLVARSMGLIP